MEYKKVSKSLEVRFEADDLDLLQLGILSSALHSIFNHVAIAIYDEANREAEKEYRPKLLDYIPQNLSREDVLVRARVVGLREGSIIYDLQPVIAAVFSQPGAIAIAQNLVANVLWALSTYGNQVIGTVVRRVSPGRNFDAPPIPATTARRRLRPRIAHLVEQLKQSGNGGKITLRSGDEELVVEFYGTAHPKEKE